MCLAKTPERVAVLDWRPLEDLLLLGVRPVAGADLADFPRWVRMDLPQGIQDLGGRMNPSLERLAALKPDLILGYTGFQAKLYPELARIAPTALYDYLPSSGQLAAMRRHFLLHARLVGKEREGERRLADLDRFLSQTADALRQAGLAGRPFLLVQAWAREKVYNVFTRDTLASELLEAVGLANAWRGKAEAYGLSRVGAEGLVRLVQDNPGVLVFLIAQPENNPLADPAVGPLLRLAKARVVALDPSTWTYGGPHSARVLVEGVRRSLLGR
ncbi:MULTISPECIES: ABC transporter substrate-binding protein [Thermus]|uniref:ABC transporter substrate-binding protein n=1 Tax=Thermus TaxID=270 RepID=UPI001F2EC72E|nr:iron-siderophore ABC transporter substrate-binding protein [Thermus brockianus]